MKKILSLLILLRFALVSCDSKKNLSEYGDLFARLMKNEKGIFRGLILGLKPSQVKEAEGVRPQQEEESYLFYDFILDTAESYTLEYNFDERGLSEMRLDAYFIQEADARALYESFKAYYTDRFGEVNDFYGFTAWDIVQDNRRIRIELADESAEYRQGKFSLLIYFSIEAPIFKKENP